MNSAATDTKTILCVSWVAYLAATRKQLLTSRGYTVESAVGMNEALAQCGRSSAHLLLLGQSVPREEKRKIVQTFRRYSNAPIISLLNVNQDKLPEVEYGIEALDPELLVRTVHSILK